MRRAAFLRPMSLLIVAIGAVAFAFTLAWWVVPLTLATYASLVFLATRDPMFQSRVLGERPPARPRPPINRRVSPERRARSLPNGETRRKVEEAFEIQRRTVFAIEESGDAARAALNDAVPKLEGVTKRLVDVAERRERTAEAIRKLGTSPAGSPSNPDRGGGHPDVAKLERALRTADAELSAALEKLSTLRARIIRVSLESEGSTQVAAAASLNADIDKLNLRLDALGSTVPPTEPTDS